MCQAQVSLSSSLPAQHLAVSSLFWLTKRLHYTLNTLHQNLHNTLTIHSKHAMCHKSLNSQNSLSLSLSLILTAAVTLPPLSLPQLPLFLSNQIMWFCSGKYKQGHDHAYTLIWEYTLQFCVNREFEPDVRPRFDALFIIKRLEWGSSRCSHSSPKATDRGLGETLCRL